MNPEIVRAVWSMIFDAEKHDYSTDLGSLQNFLRQSVNYQCFMSVDTLSQILQNCCNDKVLLMKADQCFTIPTEVSAVFLINDAYSVAVVNNFVLRLKKRIMIGIVLLATRQDLC